MAAARHLNEPLLEYLQSFPVHPTFASVYALEVRFPHHPSSSSSKSSSSSSSSFSFSSSSSHSIILVHVLIPVLIFVTILLIVLVLIHTHPRLHSSFIIVILIQGYIMGNHLDAMDRLAAQARVSLSQQCHLLAESASPQILSERWDTIAAYPDSPRALIVAAIHRNSNSSSLGSAIVLPSALTLLRAPLQSSQSCPRPGALREALSGRPPHRPPLQPPRSPPAVSPFLATSRPASTPLQRDSISCSLHRSLPRGG